MTDKELQRLRNMGGCPKRAAAEIERLRAALQTIAATNGYGRDGPSSGTWVHWVAQAQNALKDAELSGLGRKEQR